MTNDKGASSMEMLIQRVTPQQAEQWLNQNTTNRKMRDGVAEKYAHDMRNGAWTTCPEPISFFEDGTVADGQHRLWAIVESGVTVTFPIARGLKKGDGLNINTGLTRTLVDNARISGANAWLTNHILSTARAISEGVHGSGIKNRSKTQCLEQVLAHEDAVKWAVANAPTGKLLRNSIVSGAMGRAWYYEKDLARLKRFGEVVSDGFMAGDDESAAIAIRNYLLTNGTSVSTGGRWRDTFLKVQNAISYFMKGKKLQVIKAVQDEAYPLPKTARK